MYKKLLLIAASVVCFSALPSLPAFADGKSPSQSSPDNLGKVFTFIATRPFDSVDGTFFLDGMVGGDGMAFFKDVMGYSDEQIDQNRLDAIDFFQERFGLDAVNDPRLYLTGFQIDPAADYRAVLASGNEKTRNGYPILDGGWAVAVVDPAGIELGGEFAGTVVPAGTMFAAGGSYVLKRDRGYGHSDIIIDYQSRGPMQPVGTGGVINCEVTSAEFGKGVAWGYFEFHPLANGQVAAQVRNVVTFPGFGYEEEMIQE
ncbi:MAG: hypothetical protein ACI93R_001947 [Flavobacteriales bacterium]|jgi:hypothetical protein